MEEWIDECWKEVEAGRCHSLEDHSSQLEIHPRSERGLTIAQATTRDSIFGG